ncbi:MAG: PDZ domain-containing protein [Candidatus Hydrogenedentes bacterium]|nr:PDZ domain-containing protein [Candidatus Hydrogenedentota bacterium]
MVKGLLIRQALTAINILLALVIAYIIFLVCMQQFGAQVSSSPLDDLSADAAGDTIEIASVGPRSEYDAIVNGKLFGAAGTVAAPPPDAPVPVSDVVVQTSAPFKLLATVASYPTDPLATAVIDNPSATTPNKTSTYYLGRPVTENYVLLEVHRRRVILLNTEKNRKEELQMDQLGGMAALAKNTAPGGRNARVAAAGGGDSANHVSVERTAVMEELNSYDYADLMAQLNPTLVEDEKGNVTGITSASLTSIPIAKQVGLKDNDVIQAVNGITIDSEQKIGEIAQKVANANTIRLSVLRDGKPQMLTVKVQ